MIQTKLFTGYSNESVDEDINQFLYEMDAELIDIKFSASRVSPTNIMSIAALLIYEQ